MGENSSIEMSTTISWTVRLEEYFAETGEKASGLAWVHKHSEAMYSTRKTYIDLPVIIGSGLIAFLNAGSSNLFDDPKISSIALGVGSLFLGVLNSIGTYFGWSKRAEGHRISAIHYARLYRFITIELSLPRTERMIPHDLLKYVKDQYDRLAEISPMVPEIVIHAFQRKFRHEKEISKPEEANGLHKIVIFKDEDVYENESVKGLSGFMSPTPSKLKPFTGSITPKELPKMTVRIPEMAKRVESKKPEVPPSEPEPSKQEVDHTELVIDVPKSASPHED